MPFLLLALAACSRSDDSADAKSDPCAVTDPSVEIGNGEAAHSPVADGAVVTMVHGPQGGWHVWYSFEAYNFGEIVTFEITGEDTNKGITVIDETTSQALVADTDATCGGVAYGAFGYLALDNPKTADVDESPPAYLTGDEMIMHVTVTDISDTTLTAEDEVSVTLACDDLDVGVYPACG